MAAVAEEFGRGVAESGGRVALHGRSIRTILRPGVDSFEEAYEQSGRG
jgi:hypothetical protein